MTNKCIRDMTEDERQRSIEREQINNDSSSKQQQRDNTSTMPIRGLCKQ